MQSIIPRPIWLIALFCVSLLAPASAQRKQPAVGVIPPQPVQLSVKVQRGGKTEIPLSIHGKAGEPLKFLIRTQPAQGKLAEPRQTGPETAVAVYVPPADLSITSDKFYYAVQSAAGVSAPVEVLLTIIDQPPQLTILDTLEFGTVRTGDTNSKFLEISNSGGSLATGEVIVEAPWRIEGKTGYRLGAGEMAIFKLIFAPATGGTFESVARFTSDPAHSTTLRGVGETSIAVNPAELILRNVAGDPVRSGNLELVNQTDEPRKLQFKADDRLQVPPGVTLPPRGRASIAVQTAAGDVRPLQAEIRIVAPDLDVRVPVKAAAPGAILRAVQPAVTFGRIPLKPPTSARFEFENIGGAPGEVTWTIGPPFRTRQNSVLLLPGEKRGFDLEIEGKTPGPYRAWLQWKAGGETFELPVEAEIVAGIQVPRVPRAASPSAPPAEISEPASPPPLAEPPIATAAPVIPLHWFSDAKVPAGVKATANSPTTAILEWPIGLTANSRFRVDLRQLSYAPDRTLAVSWLPLEGIEITRQGSNYQAIIRELQPAFPWTVRVVALDDDPSGPGTRLFAIDFATPPKPSYLPSISLLHGLLTVLGIILVWQAVSWWRRRR